MHFQSSDVLYFPVWDGARGWSLALPALTPVAHLPRPGLHKESGEAPQTFCVVNLYEKKSFLHSFTSSVGFIFQKVVFFWGHYIEIHTGILLHLLCIQRKPKHSEKEKTCTRSAEMLIEFEKRAYKLSPVLETWGETRLLPLFFFLSADFSTFVTIRPTYALVFSSPNRAKNCSVFVYLFPRLTSVRLDNFLNSPPNTKIFKFFDGLEVNKLEFRFILTPKREKSASPPAAQKDAAIPLSMQTCFNTAELTLELRRLWSWGRGRDPIFLFSKALVVVCLQVFSCNSVRGEDVKTCPVSAARQWGARERGAVVRLQSRADLFFLGLGQL